MLENIFLREFSEKDFWNVYNTFWDVLSEINFLKYILKRVF